MFFQIRKLTIILIFGLSTLYEQKGLYALIVVGVANVAICLWRLKKAYLPLSLLDLVLSILMAAQVSVTALIVLVYVSALYCLVLLLLSCKGINVK